MKTRPDLGSCDALGCSAAPSSGKKNSRTSALWKFTPIAPVAQSTLAPGASGGCGHAALNIASSAQTALAATLLTPSTPRPAAVLSSPRR
jgi:hypothetical protein